MTYRVECENPLLSEVHVIVEDVKSMPIIIYDQLITELHSVVNGMIESDKSFTIIPREMQIGEWTWETFRGGIKIMGKVDTNYIPATLDFWLR